MIRSSGYVVEDGAQETTSYGNRTLLYGAWCKRSSLRVQSCLPSAPMGGGDPFRLLARSRLRIADPVSFTVHGRSGTGSRSNPWVTQGLGTGMVLLEAIGLPRKMVFTGNTAEAVR